MAQGQLQIHSAYRPTAGVIRVWVGIFGTPEEFTLAEAEAICRAGDRALTDDWGDREGLCAIDVSDCPAAPGDGWADDANGRFDADICQMVVRRDWLVALLAALRRILRGVEMARACSAQVAEAGARMAAGAEFFA